MRDLFKNAPLIDEDRKEKRRKKWKLGSTEQNLPQPFLMVLIGLSCLSGGTRGQRPLVKKLRYNIRLG